jgi:peptide/nickel transport system substrate-binding protein
MMKGIDAPHYDAQRTSWGPTSDVVNMIQDTLVALDWDGKTPIPYLAKSWTGQPDGRPTPSSCATTCTFCSGKKFTAEDVIYSLQAAEGARRSRGPFAWRAGDIKELRATRSLHRRVRAAEPFSELLLQLTMFTNVIHNKDSVEALGKDLRHQGRRRHRPVVPRVVAAAHADRAEAPRRLQVGPVDVQEQGAGEVREAGRSRSCRRIPAASRR